MRTALDTLISDYVRELQKELRGFPAGRRREILDEVAEHITQARSELDSESEAAIRTVLDRLGEPADIAASARERFGIRQAKAGALEAATVVALVIPFFGWLLGSVLLWLSRVWRTRDKVLGTILVPGVWALLLLTTVAVRAEGSSTSSSSCRMEGGRTFCDHPPVPQPEPSGLEWVSAALWIAVYVVPVATAIYLAVRVRNISDAAAAAE